MIAMAARAFKNSRHDHPPSALSAVSAVLAVSKTIKPPTVAERLRELPDNVKVALVAAGEVTKVTGVRSVFVIPGPRSTTVPWKPVGRRIGVIGTLGYVGSRSVSAAVRMP